MRSVFAEIVDEDPRVGNFLAGCIDMSVGDDSIVRDSQLKIRLGYPCSGPTTSGKNRNRHCKITVFHDSPLLALPGQHGSKLFRLRLTKTSPNRRVSAWPSRKP